MAETSQATAANQRPTDTVFRVHVSLKGGPRSGLPLATGFEPRRSFDSENEAEEVAEDIRNNPMEYYADALRDYDGSLKVEVSEDDPLEANL